MKHNKLNRETINKILTEYFDETALSDDDAKIILDYHKFDDETLIELALGVVGLAWGTSGRKVVDILDDFDQLNESETFEQTALLLENVLKENKRLGKLLEEKHEEWLELMDEINNQEVLSQKWIDNNSVYASSDGITEEYVHVDDLKEVLVPNQEITFEQAYEKLREESILSEKSFDYYWNCINDNVEIDEPGNLLVPRQELPVIPQFVADWLEEYKEDELIITAGTVIGNRRFPKDTKVAKWLNEDYVRNSEVFAQAWLAYPNIEVVKEQKYYIQITEHDFMVMDDEGFMYPENLNPHGYKSVFTEQEIKDYDKRFWEFRKPVEEMEE